MFLFDVNEAEDLIDSLYNIDTDCLTEDEVEAISKVTSWLVLMLQEADESPERGQ